MCQRWHWRKVDNRQDKVVSFFYAIWEIYKPVNYYAKNVLSRYIESNVWKIVYILLMCVAFHYYIYLHRKKINLTAIFRISILCWTNDIEVVLWNYFMSRGTYSRNWDSIHGKGTRIKYFSSSESENDRAMRSCFIVGWVISSLGMKRKESSVWMRERTEKDVRDGERRRTPLAIKHGVRLAPRIMPRNADNWLNRPGDSRRRTHRCSWRRSAARSSARDPSCLIDSKWFILSFASAPPAFPGYRSNHQNAQIDCRSTRKKYFKV